MHVTSTGEKYLADGTNKSRLIEALKVQFVSAGICVRQVEGEANLLILQTTIDLVTKQPASKVCIVGEDINLVVLLVYHSSLNDVNVKLLKPGKWTGNEGRRMIVLAKTYPSFPSEYRKLRFVSARFFWLVNLFLKVRPMFSSVTTTITSVILLICRLRLNIGIVKNGCKQILRSKSVLPMMEPPKK